MRYVLAEVHPANEKRKRHFHPDNLLYGLARSEEIAKTTITWSLVLKLISPSPDNPEVWLAYLSFLVDSAPHHLLYPDAELEFCEAHLVAFHIKVLSIEQDSPEAI